MLNCFAMLCCEQWAQGQIAGKNSDFNTTIGGTTAPYAVNAWYSANRKKAQTGSIEFVRIARLGETHTMSHGPSPPSQQFEHGYLAAVLCTNSVDPVCAFLRLAPYHASTANGAVVPPIVVLKSEFFPAICPCAHCPQCS